MAIVRQRPQAPSGGRKITPQKFGPSGVSGVIEATSEEKQEAMMDEVRKAVYEKAAIAPLEMSIKEKEIWMKDRVVSEQTRVALESAYESALYLWAKMAKTTQDRTGLEPGFLAGEYNRLAATKDISGGRESGGSTKRGFPNLNIYVDDYLGNSIESTIRMAKIATGGSRAPERIVSRLEGSLPALAAKRDQAFNQMISSHATQMGEYNSTHPELFPKGKDGRPKSPSDFENRKASKEWLLNRMFNQEQENPGLYDGFAEYQSYKKKKLGKQVPGVLKPGAVRMKAPEGHIEEVDAELVKEAKKAGYKVVK